MARFFDRDIGEALYVDSAPTAAYPFTMACWFNADRIDASMGLMWLGDKDATNHFWTLYVNDSEVVSATVLAGGGPAHAVSSANWTADTWRHACGVFTSSTSRAAFLDGGNKGTNATDLTPANADRIGLGSFLDFSVSSPFGGDIAEAAAWNVALTDAEVAILAKGYSPLFIRPQSLIFYVPLIRDNDEDLIGGLSLSLIQTPDIAVHPPIYYPAPPFLSFPVATVGGVDITVPVGALEITGYAPAVTVTGNIDIEIPVGALEITGYVPGIATTAHVDIEIPVGVLEIAGYAPVVTTTGNIDIEVPVGALEIEGFAPTVTTTAHIDIEVPVGVLEIEGFVPTVTVTGSVDVEVPTGALVITGYIPTVTTTGGVDITVPVASLVLTGYAPIVTTLVGTVELFLWNRAASLRLNARTPELVVDVRTNELVLEEK